MDHIKKQAKGLLKRATYQPLDDSNSNSNCNSNSNSNTSNGAADVYEMPKSIYAPSHESNSMLLQDTPAPSTYTNYTEAFPPTNPTPSIHQAIRTHHPFLSLLPLLGISALILALITILATAIILQRSNDRPLDDTKWHAAPDVLLSITSTIFQLALTSALAQGALIFWWTRALYPSGTHDLQRVWEHGQSLPSALLAGKHVNLLAIATILTTVCAAAVGPLLQRASTVVEAMTPTTVLLVGNVAAELPQGYSASFVTQSAKLSGLSLAFARVIAAFEQELPISLADLTGTATTTTCGSDGNCSAIIEAAGMTAVCDAPLVSDWAINRTSGASGLPIFQVNSTWADNGAKADGFSLEQIKLEVSLSFLFMSP
jgi:hypothetical protein